MVAAGFPVVATTSGGVAASLGWPDGEAAPHEEMFAAAARIARSVDVPVSVDVEGGYGLDAPALVDAILDAGAVGCNLEDTNHRGDAALVDAASQAARIAAVKDAARSAGVDLVVNARIDVFLRQIGPPEERVDRTVERAQRYVAAEADCTYPIGATEAELVRLAERMSSPMNAMVRPPATTFTGLRALGVARISFASHLHRLAVADLASRLVTIAAGSDAWGSGWRAANPPGPAP